MFRFNMVSDEELAWKGYENEWDYQKLTRHAREVVDAVNEMLVWDAFLRWYDNFSVRVEYSLRRDANRQQIPEEIMFWTDVSGLPHCAFMIDHRWSVEQSKKMMDWEREWAMESDLEIARIARQLKRILRKQILVGVDSRVQLEGYLTGEFSCGPFDNEVHAFKLAPIWKADAVMMRLHYKKYHNGSGASVWAFSKKKADSGRQVYCLPESLEEFNAALRQYLEQKIDDWWYYESYVLVPKAILPKEFIELQRKLDNMIFLPRKKTAG